MKRGKMALGRQPWDQSGVEDARLSQAAAAVEHEQRMAAKPKVQLGDLDVAPKEVGARFFTEAFQAEPRMLEVGQMQGSRRASVLQSSLANVWIGDGHC